MAAYNKINSFLENAFEKVHNLGADALTLAFCAAANAPIASNTVLANLTEVSYTNISSRVLSGVTSAQSSGTYKLNATDHVLTASGSWGGQRYTVLYNDTPTSPADPLICWWDYGSDLTLATGETLTIDFDGTNGIFTCA